LHSVERAGADCIIIFRRHEVSELPLLFNPVPPSSLIDIFASVSINTGTSLNERNFLKSY